MTPLAIKVQQATENTAFGRHKNTWMDEEMQSIGGRGGIRTHGTLAGTPVFKTGALNHSATLPNQQFQVLSGGLEESEPRNWHPIGT